MIGLNVGSGQRPFKSAPGLKWVNIDSVDRPPKCTPDILADGAHLPMYDDNTVDYFVLHHVLEHFGCGEAQGLIKEAFRVLKPGGSLLVFVPDLRALAERWLQGKLTTQIVMTSFYGAYMGSEEDRHKWGYDPKSLYDFLTSCCSWKEVALFDWRHIPGSDCAKDFWILGMECVK